MVYVTEKGETRRTVVDATTLLIGVEVIVVVYAVELFLKGETVVVEMLVDGESLTVLGCLVVSALYVLTNRAVNTSEIARETLTIKRNVLFSASMTKTLTSL